MVWAMLAAYLTRKPPAVQACVLGLSTGLFVVTAANANDRGVTFEAAAVQLAVSGLIAGVLFERGLALQRRKGWSPDGGAPRWLYLTYASVWLLSLVAALASLFGAGGFTVAAFAIIPLVLLGPTAIRGISTLLHRDPSDALPVEGTER